MHRTIAIAFSTLDGVIEDPDGSAGTPNGGWAFRHGTKLFTSEAAPTRLRLVSAETVSPAVLIRYEREGL